MVDYIPVDYDPFALAPNQELQQAGYTVAPNGIAYQGAPPQQRYDEALQQLYGLTGVPDLMEAYKALLRGEPMQALGQGTAGAANLAAIAAPLAKGAMMGARSVVPVLRDVTGATPIKNALGRAAENPLLSDTERLKNNLLPQEGTVVAPIKAYHGSPYDFDAFDLSKIGTGEGAQAYGHGLYFAQNEGVARSYRDNLAGIPIGQYPDIFLNGKKINLKDLKQESPEFIAISSMNDPLVGGNVQEKVNNLKEFGFDDAANWLENNHANLEIKPHGRMYEVNINADPETFLHWDKPLSEQPNVVKALQSLGINEPPKIESKGKIFGGWENEQGQDVVSRLTTQLGGADKASEALRKAGISGIKYLDQGSRSSGEGTHNYVVFDPSMIDIVKKYGLAPLIAGGAMTLGGNADAATHLVPVDHDPFAEQP